MYPLSLGPGADWTDRNATQNDIADCGSCGLWHVAFPGRSRLKRQPWLCLSRTPRAPRAGTMGPARCQLPCWALGVEDIPAVQKPNM
jgi:hypothetical protein